MARKETKASLKEAISSLEANLAEERANHDITRKERDGFKEKYESAEEHLEAAYEDLKEASDHIFFHHQQLKRETVLSKYRIESPHLDGHDDMLDALRVAGIAFKKPMPPLGRSSTWEAKSPNIVALPDQSPVAIALAAALGTVLGGTFLFFIVWLLIRFSL